MSILAKLRALHTTIGSALDEIERTFVAQNLDFPPIDTPIYKNNPDAESVKHDAAEKLTKDPTVVRASTFAVAACGQIINIVRNPAFNLVEAITAVNLTASLQFLEASHAVEILRVAGPEGLHVSELAQKIDYIRSAKGPIVEPLDPSRLSHVLRLLAALEWGREVRPDVFANNRLSATIDSGKAPEQIRAAPEKKYDETDGLCAIVPMTTNEPFQTMRYLSEWLLHPNPDIPRVTTFNYAYRTEDNFYSWLERPENALRLVQVGRAMSSAGSIEGTITITHAAAFPWDSLPPNALVVDVGGGVGSVSVQLASKYSHLRFIVQDRAQTVAVARKVWGDKHADLFGSGRVVFQVQDFFTPQPKSFKVAGVSTEVKHPAVFILTRVLHNWPDDECKKILANLREAAGPDTKLVIVDQVLPLACADDSPASDTALAGSLAPAGSPLLPNLGKALAAGYQFDLEMMALLDSKERTLREIAVLAGETGWRITRAKRTEGALWTFTTLIPI